MSIAAPDDGRQTQAVIVWPLPGRDPLPLSLPTPTTPLVGREREIAAVVDVLADPLVRLVTLTGPGGVGKTRLAIAAATAAALPGERFSGGVAFVDLARIADPTLVPSAIAAAIGVRETAEAPILETVMSFLGERAALLVLDNVEHLPTVAVVTAAVLEGCPGLSVVATGRAPLRVAGECVFLVVPLGLPAAAASPAAVAEAAAVRLFVARAKAVHPEFALGERNARTVAEVCRRLDGLPLAIELAAARVAVFPPAALLRRLEQRWPVPLAGPHTAPVRHQTLRAAIAWSHDLLADWEQALFRRLAVFADGATIEAAELVMSGGEWVADLASDQHPAPIDVVGGIVSLVEQSLLRSIGGEEDGEPRYRMLETVREFAWERLEESGEATVARRRHAEWCLGLVEWAEPELWHAQHDFALDRLGAELENLRAALAWAIELEPEMALRLAGGLWQFWFGRYLLAEGRGWLERALIGADGAAPADRARALRAVGALATAQDDLPRAVAALEEGVALARQLGDRFDLARALLHLGEALQAQGQWQRAVALWDEALGLLREPEDNRTIAEIYNLLGIVTGNNLEYQRSVAMHERALLLMRESGDRQFEALQLQNIGVSVGDLGDFRRAAALCAEAVAIYRTIGDKYGLGQALHNLSAMHFSLGDRERALAEVQEALTLAVETGNREFLYLGLESVADLAVGFGHAEQAARFLGAALGLRNTLGISLTTRDVHLRAELLFPQVTAALGEEALAAGMEAGRLAPLDVIVAAALAVTPPAPAPASAAAPLPAALIALTTRERQVLRLMAEGRTDRDIAAALFISRPTASKHVASILAKLDVATRSAAAAVGVRYGLA